MKNLSFLLTGIILLFFYGCSHYCCDAARPDKFMSALRNNVEWTAVASGSNTVNDTIKMLGVGVNMGSNLHDTLSIQIKYTSPGTYKIAPNQVFYHTRLGNGLPYNSYKIDTLFNNSVIVTGYDPNAARITGTFTLKFVDPADTAGISFLYGNFKVPTN